MLFGDEKDYSIDDSDEIQISDDDGTVTWEDVLSSDDDEISIDSGMNDEPAAAPPPKREYAANMTEGVDLISDLEDDVSDEELARILSDADSDDDIPVEDDIAVPTRPAVESAPAGGQAAQSYGDDSDFGNIVLDDEEVSQPQPKRREYKMPAKELPQRDESYGQPAAKPKANQGGKIFIVLVILAVVVGAYFFVTNSMGGDELSGDDQGIRQEQNDTVEDISNDEQDSDIPVVNEEDISSVEPEEQVEKKETIEVKPTGRPNPFVPLKQYAAPSIVSVPTTEIVYSSTAVALPPERYGAPDERVDKLITIAVSGIMYDDQKPSAIITYDDNDYFVQKGDRLDDYRVVDIARNYVVIALGNNTYRANVGEEFKINDKFYGSAQYFPGGRHYHAVGVGESGEKQPPNQRYVSEQDIQIQVK